jgi:C1A family cysteine protease
MAEPFIGGWLQDEEDWENLYAMSGEHEVLALMGSYNEVSLDPRRVVRVENQGSQGSCQGHSISSVVEWCYYLASNDLEKQLSRAMGYYESQRLDRISGDRGSTISAGVRLATNTGICSEPLWPYPSSYNQSRPSNWDAVLQDAATYRIGRSIRLTTYEAVRTFLGSGQGGINIGISWGSGMSRAVVESFSAGGGGHAIALLSLSDRKDSAGQPYVWMLNSWGSNFGNKGWSEWSPRAIGQMMSSRSTACIGCSDMPHVKPREISLDQIKKKLRV